MREECPKMTFTEFGIVYNATGVATLFLVSFIISRRYPEPFFKDYVKAYLCSVGLLLIELVAALAGRSITLNVLGLVLIPLTASFFPSTSCATT